MSELLTPEEMWSVYAGAITDFRRTHNFSDTDAQSKAEIRVQSEAISKAQLAKDDKDWEAKIKAERERIIKEIEGHSWICEEQGCAEPCRLDVFLEECIWWQSLKEQIREDLK